MAWDFIGTFKSLFKKSQPEKMETLADAFSSAVEQASKKDRPAIYGYINEQGQFHIGMYGGTNDYLAMMADLMMHGTTILSKEDDQVKLALLAQLNKITVVAVKQTTQENQLMKNPIGGGDGLPN